MTETRAEREMNAGQSPQVGKVDDATRGSFESLRSTSRSLAEKGLEELVDNSSSGSDLFSRDAQVSLEGKPSAKEISELITDPSIERIIQKFNESLPDEISNASYLVKSYENPFGGECLIEVISATRIEYSTRELCGRGEKDAALRNINEVGEYFSRVSKYLDNEGVEFIAQKENTIREQIRTTAANPETLAELDLEGLLGWEAKKAVISLHARLQANSDISVAAADLRVLLDNPTFRYEGLNDVESFNELQRYVDRIDDRLSPDAKKAWSEFKEDRFSQIASDTAALEALRTISDSFPARIRGESIALQGELNDSAELVLNRERVTTFIGAIRRDTQGVLSSSELAKLDEFISGLGERVSQDAKQIWDSFATEQQQEIDVQKAISQEVAEITSGVQNERDQRLISGFHRRLLEEQKKDKDFKISAEQAAGLVEGLFEGGSLNQSAQTLADFNRYLDRIRSSLSEDANELIGQRVEVFAQRVTDFQQEQEALKVLNQQLDQVTARMKDEGVKEVVRQVHAGLLQDPGMQLDAKAMKALILKATGDMDGKAAGEEYDDLKAYLQTITDRTSSDGEKVWTAYEERVLFIRENHPDITGMPVDMVAGMQDAMALIVDGKEDPKDYLETDYFEPDVRRSTAFQERLKAHEREAMELLSSLRSDKKAEERRKIDSMNEIIEAQHQVNKDIIALGRLEREFDRVLSQVFNPSDYKLLVAIIRGEASEWTGSYEGFRFLRGEEWQEFRRICQRRFGTTDNEPPTEKAFKERLYQLVKDTDQERDRIDLFETEHLSADIEDRRIELTDATEALLEFAGRRQAKMKIEDELVSRREIHRRAG